MEEIIKKILEVAVYAPSGENAQPWKFVIKSNQLSVFNIPERDQSLYNHEQKGSYVAHGALIENIAVAASQEGYQIKISLFPDDNNSDYVAVIGFEKSAQKNEPLYPYIRKRTTNRKPYKDTPLTNEQLQELKDACKEGEGVDIFFVQEKEKKEILGEAGSVNERVMFTNKFIHNFFFNHVNWTKEEEEKKRVGFYIKTLELPLPAQKAMKIFRHWPIMNVFNKIGLAKGIAKGNAKTYASSSAMIAGAANTDNPKDCIAAGRVMQRLWLTATKRGLSAQPLTGVLFFMKKIADGEIKEFSQEHIKLITDAYKNINTTFGVQNKAIIVMMRIGEGGEPTAKALRLEPIISSEN